LAGADLESQFAMLESGSGVDDELAALKADVAALSKSTIITTFWAIRWKSSS